MRLTCTHPWHSQHEISPSSDGACGSCQSLSNASGRSILALSTEFHHLQDLVRFRKQHLLVGDLRTGHSHVILALRELWQGLLHVAVHAAREPLFVSLGWP